VTTPYTPDRGDLIWLSFDPQSGHEQAGRRPAPVLSPKSYNAASGLALICPITNRIKGYPFEVVLPVGMAITGAVLADHVKSLDWQARRAVYADAAPDTVLNEVIQKLDLLLR
jgi:mRNA interferase MazF